MSLPIPPDFERAVLERVRAGMYESVEEVLRACLEALEREEENRGMSTEDLRREIRRGREQLDRGESLPGDEAFRLLRERREGADG
ncbi:MAG TPA: hypothetical protein VHG91_17645 [Longimicrobium sp.]|nr:hypothetical protein [Longimicrobium sp.]